MSNKSGRPSFADNAQGSLAVIFSVAGPQLTQIEKDFFRHADPFGFILFGRNCVDPAQLRVLTEDLKSCVGRECPVLIDQEGGRVQRLKPPRWREFPPMRSFGDLAQIDMDHALADLRFTILQLAEELNDAGLNVNCAPVLDVLTPETHEAIGDRAFSDDPAIVSRLGLCVARNLLKSGVTPIIKHMPGHGRATLDSHKVLPRVDAALATLNAIDFRPFREIAASDVGQAVWGMMAHIVFEGIDPDHPSSVSPLIIRDIIRGQMGFQGLLLSDDLDMDALGAYGDAPARCRAVLEAGCDVALYCSGRLPDMEKIAETVPKLGISALRSLQKAAEFRKVAA